MTAAAGPAALRVWHATMGLRFSIRAERASFASLSKRRPRVSGSGVMIAISSASRWMSNSATAAVRHQPAGYGKTMIASLPVEITRWPAADPGQGRIAGTLHDNLAIDRASFAVHAIDQQEGPFGAAQDRQEGFLSVGASPSSLRHLRRSSASPLMRWSAATGGGPSSPKAAHSPLRRKPLKCPRPGCAPPARTPRS